MLVNLARRTMLALIASGLVSRSATAQISVPMSPSGGGTQVATLEQQLINRLRATTADRKAYIRLVVEKTETGALDTGMVRAIERYAIKQNPRFPFPYFERAMHFEAERRGVYLPPVRLLVGTGHHGQP